MKLKKIILTAFIISVMLIPMAVQASGYITSYGTRKTTGPTIIYCYAWTGAHGAYARVEEDMYDIYSGQYLGLLTHVRTVLPNSNGNAWAQADQQPYNGESLRERTYHSTDVACCYSS